VVTYAHAAIDAGADIFIVHGPHNIRGIEIYKGKPIIYSLGNFIFDGEAGIPYAPSEIYERYHLPWNINIKVLLMDEPFGSLDSFTRMELEEELMSIWQRQRFTCFLLLTI